MHTASLLFSSSCAGFRVALLKHAIMSMELSQYGWSAIDLTHICGLKTE